MDRLQSMKVFQRVADEGGFAAAARALDMSPPVVTRLVADLEQHLGTRLLQRSTRKLSLTEAGQSYLHRIRSILQDIEEADATAAADTRGLTGLLRVRAQPVLATYVIAPLLAEFRLRYPGIRIDLDVDTSPDSAFEEYDLTLLGTGGGFDADVVARKVVDSEAVLVAAPAYLQRRGLPQSPQDLAAHDCLRLKLGATRPGVWRLWCGHSPATGASGQGTRRGEEQEVLVGIQPVLLANHTDTLLRAALDGAGITSLSMDIAAPYLTRGELQRVLHPWITGRLSMYAVLPSRKFMPQRTRVFLDYLVQEAREQSARALEACEACRA